MGLGNLLDGVTWPSAALMVAAWSCGWLTCVKIRVEPLRKELDEAKAELREFLIVAKTRLLGGGQ